MYKLTTIGYVDQVYKEPGNPDEVGPPVVMRSAAGWYIGHLYWDEEMQGWFPWSRQTDYMTEEEAVRMWKQWAEEMQ